MDKIVFISHSSKDADISMQICKELEQQNIGCWIAPRDVIGGMPYADEIVKAIKECKVVLLVASSAINTSEQILNEIEIAVNHSKIILPFKIDEMSYNDSYTYYLHRKHWIEAIPDPNDFFSELVTTVKYLLTKNGEVVDTIDDTYLISLAEKNRKKLIKKTEEKRYSFGLSIEADNYDDKHHFYDYIKRIDIVDSSTNTYSSYRWITITNKSDEPTTHIIHKECGENKINFIDMRFKAKSINNDNSSDALYVESLTNIQPNFIQVVKIFFKKPLMPNESLTIFYRLDWVGEALAYCQEALSTSISLTRYTKGVGHLIFGILNTEETFGFELKEIHNNFEENVSKIPPQIKNVQDDEQLKPLHKKKLSGAYFDIADAKDFVSYRIDYNKIKNENNADDEEFF